MSGIRLLHVPVQIGPKNAPACKKSYDFWDACVQQPIALDLTNYPIAEGAIGPNNWIL